MGVVVLVVVLAAAAAAAAAVVVTAFRAQHDSYHCMHHWMA